MKKARRPTLKLYKRKPWYNGREYAWPETKENFDKIAAMAPAFSRVQIVHAASVMMQEAIECLDSEQAGKLIEELIDLSATKGTKILTKSVRL